VPEGQLVDSPEAAWVAAQEIGLPVVVKPYDGNRGRGVSLDLQTQSSVEAAWHAARLESKYVLVERYVRGEEHRLLVVGDRVVAATRGETVSITGDGVSTIEQLVNTQVNNDPRRGDIEIYPLAAVRFHGPDHLIHLLEIQRQGLEPTSVPTLGQRVIVQRNGNLNIDVTDDIHPDVAAIATLATRVVGLDIAGIDIVAQDITRPLLEQGGAVIEVNAGPGLLMHRKPAVGKPRPVGEAIMQHLFGSQEHARIPIVGVIGSQQTPQIAQLTAWLLHLSGRRTGLANQQGLFMAQRQVESRDARGFDFAERLLINRALDAAVIETSPRHILEDGLPYDRCAIAIVTDMPATDDVLRDEHDILNEEKMRNVVRTQVDVVLATGAAVLNADEPAVVSLAELCDGEVVYYARDFNQPLLKEHRQQGHRVVSCRDGQVILARGEQETALFHLDVTLFSRLLNEGLELPTLLASVAAAWALDITPQLIRAGLKNFGQTPSVTSPNPTISA
jgi:cyanophycin synthetase